MRCMLVVALILAGCHAAKSAAADGGLGGLGAATFTTGELDAPSHGGTITFENIGAPGWYPSRRDPKVGPCDQQNSSTCCTTKHEVTGTDLTPWDEDLVLTLRGPVRMKQFAVYQPDASATSWSLVSAWDGTMRDGLAFDANGTAVSSFPGSVGTECLVNLSTDRAFACGAGSVPYCPAPSSGDAQYWGWSGSKLFVVLAQMPHATDVPGGCSMGTTGNWYDAPWIGLSHGELVRAGAFSSCQCYAKDPAKGYLADGCGQFNVFEVVNDNNSSKNLDVFSTNFIGYAGYVGQGPCGAACEASKWMPPIDLVDKKTDLEATMGAVATPTGGPGAAFRRPESGYRYFVVLLDVKTRTVQLAMIHPNAVPGAAAALLPALPASIDRTTIDALLALRLPH